MIRCARCHATREQVTILRCLKPNIVCCVASFLPRPGDEKPKRMGER